MVALTSAAHAETRPELPAPSASLGVALRFPEGAADLSPSETRELAYLWGHDCRVLTPSPLERAALTAAARRIGQALGDRRVRTLVADKADWMIESPTHEGLFAASDSRGEAILADFDRLAAGARTVSIFAYDGTADRPCRAPVVGDTVNAYTPTGVPVILFHRPYLEALTHAVDREAGMRRLTRTLTHELAHVLGYTHQDAPAAIGSADYDNTVPTYMGCVATSWPDLAFAAAHCHEAEWERPPAAWAWSCDRRARAAVRAPGEAVEVRVGDAWLEGKVLAIDDRLGRVRVDLGLPQTEPSWIDACRLR